MIDLLFAWLWQGTLVVIVATLAVRLVPAGAAACRHAIWWLALVAVVCLPLILLPVNEPVPSIASTPPGEFAPWTLPAPPAWLTPLLVALWCGVALVGLIRVLLSVRAFGRLVRGSAPLDPIRESRLATWNEVRPSLSRAVRLRVSDEVRGACAIGFVRPTLLISSELERTLDDAALEAIVLHELAHVERYDDWSHLVEGFLVACGGLHPAVWWTARQITVEREIACDQRVVGRTGAPVVYARSLADAASAALRSRGAAPTFAPGSSTTGSLLRRRVERLLARRTPKTAAIWSGAAASAASILTAVVMVSQSPALVAFGVTQAALLRATALWAGDITMSGSGAGIVLELSAPIGPAAPQPAGVVADAQGRPLETASDPLAVAVTTPADRREVLPSVVTEAAPLTSRTIGDAPVTLKPPVAVVQIVEASIAAPIVRAGTAAANAGVVTGLGAARAGTAVGRWFRDRAVEIAGK